MNSWQRGQTDNVERSYRRKTACQICCWLILKQMQHGDLVQAHRSCPNWLGAHFGATGVSIGRIPYRGYAAASEAQGCEHAEKRARSFSKNYPTGSKNRTEAFFNRAWKQYDCGNIVVRFQPIHGLLIYIGAITLY